MLKVLKVLEGHTNAVIAVAISTDGAKVVSGSRDNTVRAWSTETGEVYLRWFVFLMFLCCADGEGT